MKKYQVLLKRHFCLNHLGEPLQQYVVMTVSDNGKPKAWIGCPKCPGHKCLDLKEGK